ncbi:FAD-binding oxidoreductase [bacterium]|nr:FAD-binding oxidoreductase [bacterium]
MLSIEQSCYWMASSTFEYEPPLEGAQRSEIAIVGGGLTGLWTAVFLKEMVPDLDVTLLEQGMVGYGGSGRNAGMIDVSIDHSHAMAIAHFGFEEAKKMARIGTENIKELIAFLETSRIDCDLERNGRFFVALSPSQIEEAQESLKVAEQLGIAGWRWLDREEMQREVHSPLYLGAVFSPGASILNPFKLVQGLKSFLKSGNVRIHERTRVKSLSGGEIRCEHGSLKANKIIVATDAFTHHLLPGLLSRFIPLYDYILVSEPLTAQQQEAIGWQKRQGITDGRTFFNYYRLTADNRILFGTSEAKYYSANRVGPEFDHSTFHYEALHDSFLRHFPQLANLQFPFAWGGPIASTTRLTPFFGSTHNGKVLYALGYTGHGLGSTRIAAKVLAHRALWRATELFDLKMVREKPFPYPPEPFRSLAVRLVTRSLRRVDAGENPGLLLKILNRLGIGFSS